MGFVGIRCDGELPCCQCTNSGLTCKREHIPKRRGPKKGSGRIINELRAQENAGVEGIGRPVPRSDASATGSYSTGQGS